MSSKFFIVIVTYNGIQWLERCLASTDPYEVIVVDNNSTDATVSYIKDNFPAITLLEQKENLGFGSANNLGIRYALDSGAEAVFLLNQDAYLEKGTLEKLIKTQEENQCYGILSPIHLNGKGDKLDFNFSKYLTHECYSDYVLGHPSKTVYSVPFVNAAGWLISKKCLHTVGGFDPIFFHYGEDDNYCQRVIFHKLKIGIVPHFFLKHDREYRKTKNLNSLHEHYKSLEKCVKIKKANINIALTGELEDIIKRRKRAMLKSYLKLNLRAANNFKSEFLLYKRILPEIVDSREINKTKGLHYI